MTAFFLFRYESSEIMFGRKPVLPIDINEKQTKPDILDLDKQCNMEEAVGKFTAK